MSGEHGLPGGPGEIPPEIERAIRAEMERRQKVKEAVEHFYQGEYVALETVELEVVKVGWQDENFFTPMVLMSKAKRKELGVEIGDIVKVEANGVSLPALVERQFRDCYDGVSVNKLVGHVLKVKARTTATASTATPDDDGQVPATMAEAGSMLKVSTLI